MKASAPASSANLGPGFDMLALAVDLRCEVSVDVSDAWDLPDDPDGFIEAAARRMSERPLRVRVSSDIPVGKGLGSSAALLTAMEAAIGGLAGVDLDRLDLFSRVASAEGHPDNAAAAVYGGLVLAHAGEVHLLEIHPSLAVVIGVPAETLPTSDARSALPADVPFAVASRTASRAVRLVEGLRSGDLALLSGVGADELHEPARAELRPIIGRLLAAARAGGASHVALSGAGPSAIAIAEAGSAEAVAARMAEEDCVVLRPDVALDGVKVSG